MITRDNYESYFMDYLEDNLPENMIDQFLDFLNQNPDLKQELHLFEEVNLPGEHVVFQEKKQLYKGTAEEDLRLETNCIAYLEGDLDDSESKAFETYLAAHPELKVKQDLFAKTRLTADTKIHFPEKRKLYQKSGTTIGLNWAARAAAIIVLAWGINSVIQMQNAQKKQTPTQEFAAVRSNPVQPKQQQAAPAVATTVNRTENQPTHSAKPKEQKHIPTTRAEKTRERTAENRKVITRDTTLLATIKPIAAPIETSSETALAFHHSVNVMTINDPQNVLTIDQFLAMQAKKVGKEGLFSVQRIARLGLNLASELSGERIGYKTKDGKITSVDFESKLMAFSIPLEKK